MHLFSRERGKLHAVAKGARKPTSKFGARLDFFSRSRLTLHPGRSLAIVTSAQTIAGAWERLVDPHAYAFCSYAAEVVDGLCEPDLPVPELFDVLCDVQQAIAAGAAPESLAPLFDMRALAALGWSPELDACARCGSTLGRRPLSGGRARLSPDAGGLVCANCYEGELAQQTRAGLVNLTARELSQLRALRAASFADVAAREVDPKLLRSLTHATHAFVEFHLGRAARALSSEGSRRTRRPRVAAAR